MAKVLGQCLFAQLPKDYPFVCIDSVDVQNGDYIDIGNPVIEGIGPTNCRENIGV